jgi:hypothetical protein
MSTTSIGYSPFNNNDDDTPMIKNNNQQSLSTTSKTVVVDSNHHLVKILELLDEGGDVTKQVVYDYLQSSFINQRRKRVDFMKQLSEPSVMIIVSGVLCMLLLQFSTMMMRISNSS